MENNQDTNKNKGLLKLMLPVIVIVLGIIGYFVYQGFSADGNTNSATNSYLASTKLGKDVDIINKENLSFTTNINNQTLKQSNTQFDTVTPSQVVGRSNPFLP